MVSQWQVSDFVDFGQFAYQRWTSVEQPIFLLTKLVSYYAFVITPQGLSVTSALRKKIYQIHEGYNEFMLVLVGGNMF